MGRRISLACMMLVFLNACVPVDVTSFPTPTLLPFPSAIIQPTALVVETGISSPTTEPPPILESTFTSEPTITGPQPTLPAFTPPSTQAATIIPQPVVGSSAIQFYAPGPLSKLASPLTLNGYAIPGFNNVGNVILYGEDGRVLATRILQLNTAFTWAYFYGTLPFQIQAAGELARLTMNTGDQYGRLTAVNSVHLILLSEGFSIINPPGDLRERSIIEKPVPGRRIGGGLLVVAGSMRPFNSLPMLVDLVGRDGKIIASQPVAITPAPDDAYVPFQVDLPYSISIGTWALLTVRQPDDRIDGTMYLYSREVYLNP